MTNNIKTDEGLYFAYEGAIRNKIDTQVILQLLVKKGIVTSEEVSEMREYVSKQNPYKGILESLSKYEKEINEEKKFEDIMKRKLSGREISEEEKNYVLNKL